MIFFESQGDFTSQKEQYNLTSTTPLGYDQNKRINKDKEAEQSFHSEAGKQEVELLTKLCKDTLLLQ